MSRMMRLVNPEHSQIIETIAGSGQEPLMSMAHKMSRIPFDGGTVVEKDGRLWLIFGVA